MRWPFRRKKKTDEELDKEYEEYRDKADVWLFMSASRKAEKIAELKCDKHLEAEFERYSSWFSWFIVGDPVIFICKECGPKGEGTSFHYCSKCGWVKNWPRGEAYKSPEWTWHSLCGRQGTHYFCIKCNKHIGSIYYIIS